MHAGHRRRVTEGIKELLAERALAHEATRRRSTSRELRALMDEARARRLQPHYIERVLPRRRSPDSAAESRPRETRRFEITTSRPRCGTATPAAPSPPATNASRSTRPCTTPTAARAELLAPGHPLARRCRSTTTVDSSASIARPRARCSCRADLATSRACSSA